MDSCFDGQSCPVVALVGEKYANGIGSHGDQGSGCSRGSDMVVVVFSIKGVSSSNSAGQEIAHVSNG